jgi:hypothetical protein
MQNITLVLLVFAFCLFCLASVPISAPWHPRLIAAGLAFFTASFLFGEGIRIFGGGYAH